MLRPSESKVIFLQQLGRGLRSSEGKTRLLVIDFVGNHRIFAQRLIHLLSLQNCADSWTTLRSWLNGTSPDLPDGCLIDVELEAKDILRQFLPQGRNASVEGYRTIRDELGRRPSMLEVFCQGLLPRTISAEQGSWFTFAESEGDLSRQESEVVQSCVDWLKMLETTSLNKSYKMVVLRVLLDEGALFQGIEIQALCVACRRYMLNHKVLRNDLEGDRHAVDHKNADNQEWTKWWIKWPISRWLDVQNGKTWFYREGERFRLNFDCKDEWKSCLEQLTEEIVDWRLAAYTKTHRLDETTKGELVFEAKVSHSQGRPILFFPDNSKVSDRPVGLKTVQLADGKLWGFRFVSVGCKVAMPSGGTSNQLGELLKKWFGKNAGLPGTNFVVRFATRNGVWYAEPSEVGIDANLTPIETLLETPVKIEPYISPTAKFSTHVPVYDVSAAAGDWGVEGSANEIGWIYVPNQYLKKGMFAARVVGHSMEPRIPSGAFCLFRQCPAGSREGKLLLVQVNTHESPEDGGRYTVKRYHSKKELTPDGWRHDSIELQPLNADYKPIVITVDDADTVRVIGEFVCIID